MEWMQKTLKQPSEDTVLIRYMDEWKFKHMQEYGLPFTQLSNQKDKVDGMMIGDESGYARFINNLHKRGYRSYDYISCWITDIKPTVERLNEYCNEPDKPRFAVKTTYKRLINFLKSHNDFNKSKNCYAISYMNKTAKECHSGYFYLLYGNVEYCDDDTYTQRPWKDGAAHQSFMKREKYKEENEFRLLLSQASGVYAPHEDNYIVQSNTEPSRCMPLYGELYEFIDVVYRLDPGSNDFIEKLYTNPEIPQHHHKENNNTHRNPIKPKIKS